MLNLDIGTWYLDGVTNRWRNHPGRAFSIVAIRCCGETFLPLPEELTAENGAKALLSGEFHEIIEVDNPDYCGCGECDPVSDMENEETLTQKIPVSWVTIKGIYKRIVQASLKGELNAECKLD